MRNFLRLRQGFPYALAMLFVATLVVSVFAMYVDAIGMMLALGDSKANLNLARFAVDSLTPGMSQIGVWNPLIHIVLIPAVAVWMLFQTGWAGFFTIFPFFLIACYFLWRICSEVTERPVASLLAPALFILNPFVLYFSVTPMTEILMIGILCATAYPFLLWWKTNNPNLLFWSGLGVAFGSLARFEGLMLLPITGLIVIFRCWYLKMPRAQLLSMLLLYYAIACLGLFFILGYSWFYTGDPLYFASDALVVKGETGVEEVPRPMLEDLTIVYVASRFIFGLPLLVAFVVAIVLLPFFYRKKVLGIVSTIALLFAPLLFMLFALFTNKRIILVPPYGPFINDRYVLPAILTLVIVTVLGIVKLWPSNRSRFITLRRLLFLLAAGFVLFSSSRHFVKVAFTDRFDHIKQNVAYEVPTFDRAFRDMYDYGFVFATHFNNETFMYTSGLPLSRFVYEANYRYHEQVQREPWLFARWAVILEGQYIRSAFEDSNITESDAFKYFYDLVYVELSRFRQRKIYKLNEAHLRENAKQLDIDPLSIPSLNPDNVRWDPLTIYQELRSGRSGR